jgi:diguanylate cyclase (GGDEF)-like protein
MSWGIVETDAGPLLLAIGRDVSDRRAAEARTRAVAAMGNRALEGADPAELAGEAVRLLRTTLPIAGAAVRTGAGVDLAADGPLDGASHLPIGPGDELLVLPASDLTDEETSMVRAVAHTLATALARLRNEERMRHEALHDPLTGLANRTLLRDRLEQALARAHREGGETGVVFIDLDEFKAVNDTHGHAAGDAVLVELGRRLRSVVRPADTVTRLGGDEFVVVCEQVDEAAAMSLARRVEVAIRLPLSAGGVEHRLTASIGVALGTMEPADLLAHADAAVYRAKAAGGAAIEVFRPR